ncbi:MAG: hypothetical protein QNI93_22185 [Kiloniellales bacterium]|nr:hypothetical protein [Kiloniellales bacterium]
MTKAKAIDRIVLALMALCAALLIPPRAGADEVTDCDRLAADPWDARRVVEPQALSGANAGVAVAACRSALEARPGLPRLKLQLGRALLFQGFPPKALEPLSQAAESDYAAAEFYLGFAYERRGWDGHDAAAARAHYEKGGRPRPRPGPAQAGGRLAERRTRRRRAAPRSPALAGARRGPGPGRVPLSAGRTSLPSTASRCPATTCEAAPIVFAGCRG